MLRLYDFAPSANCLKVRILLAHLGLRYERVPVDLFAGETLTPEYLARNPAGRAPVLELADGESLPESNAILLYLAEGTPYLPADRLARARVNQWLFFEQNLVEPNLGTAQFWRLTGRAEQRPEVFAQKRDAGQAALEILERHLTGREFVATDDYTVADISLYAYVHLAPQAGIDLSAFPVVEAWLGRVESQSGFVNDLAPYPPNAFVGAGDRSVHDPRAPS
jgi:glutathione S-transferase